MAWIEDKNDVEWCVESYDYGVATYTTPKGKELTMESWRYEDKVEVARGLSEDCAEDVVEDINDEQQTWDHQVHATMHRVGDSGQYEVRKSTHDLVYVGSTVIDSGSGSGSGV